MKLVLIAIYASLIANTVMAMSQPPAGASSGSYDLGYRQFLASKNDSWASGIRASMNVLPFFLSIEKGFVGNAEHIPFFGLNIGLGSGPFLLPPIVYNLQPFGRINMVGARWREKRYVSYSGFEAGLSQHVSEKWGWFSSISIDYPGLLGVPLAVFPNVRDDIRKRDGFVAFFNFGIAFDPWGPFKVQEPAPVNEKSIE